MARGSIWPCGFAIESSASGPKVVAARPRGECIGKGKARTPYEFGCKVSIVTPVTAPKGGQFVLHAKALHGNPYDGHTLGPVIADLEKLTGAAVRRIHGDKGYRGHSYPDRFRVWISGQVRRVTKAIRREMRRRAAVEPVIGHLKDDHRMRRNYLKGRDGDRINAVLAAAGYNFSLSGAGSKIFCASCYRSSVIAGRSSRTIGSMRLDECEIVGREFVIWVATRRHRLILLKNRSIRFGARYRIGAKADRVFAVSFRRNVRPC